MKQNRPIAYGESTYDFEGRKQFAQFPDEVRNFVVTPPMPDGTTDNTTKTLIYLAIGGVAFTGLLILILGRRKK